MTMRIDKTGRKQACKYFYLITGILLINDINDSSFCIR